MPVFLPFVLPAIGALSAGIGAVKTIGGLFGDHGGGQQGPSASDIAAQQKAQQDAQNQAQVRAAQQAAKQFAPNVQAQLGGAVSPDYYAQTVAGQTGYGDQLEAVRQALAQQGIAPQGGGSSSNLTTAGFMPPTGGGGAIPDFQQYLNGSGFHGI